ncbi:MAG: 50S ribosomal protein L19 [Candidatus Nomurabacteria bacterium]|nr:50S ribosomal protein L19 [Candidatus Nomurabacteria bacterium]
MNRRDLDVKSGDVVRVHIKIQEKGKTRTQIFEGLVLARKHGREMGGTFTVRKISNGVGVERIFPLYSPSLEKIEVVRRSRTRRSKLYFLREKVAREIRRKMRNFLDFTTSTDDLEKIQEAGLAETPDFVEPEEAPEATTDEATAAEESKEEEKSE